MSIIITNMRYTFEDCVKRSNISIDILVRIKINWIFIINLILGFVVLLFLNLIIFSFLKFNYFEYFFGTKLYSLFTINIVILIINIIIITSFIIEAKILKKYRIFYYLEERECFKNLFSNEIIVFSSFLLLFILSIFAFEKYKNFLTLEKDFLNFSSMYFFMLFPILLVLIFYFYRYLFKYVVVYFVDLILPFMYPENEKINALIDECKVNNREINAVIIEVKNINKIKKQIKFLTKTKIIEKLKSEIKRNLNKDLFIFTVNKRKGIIILFDETKTEILKEEIQNKLLPYFESFPLSKKKKVKMEIRFNTINIHEDINIKEAFDLIGEYI